MTATDVAPRVGIDPTVLPEFRWRVRRVAICVLFIAFAFNSDAGRIAADTKVDLTANPIGFLGRSLHMWDSLGFSGQVQNQAYGYLFPIGPFFALGKVAHISPWVTQRLWWSLLLIVAFFGVIRLCDALDVGTPLSRTIAGVAFALSPHVLSVIGPVSAEALPMCLAPWVIVPLVAGSRSGSIAQAAFRSGAVVFCMGGANAALDLAALAPAGLWLLSRRPGPRTWRLLAAWMAAVGIACLWWLIPLVLLGRYSPPFLDYIESASTTTGITSLVESMRGSSDWVGFLPSAGWRAGWLLLTQPAVIVNSGVVVALGLVGLAMRRCPERLWLVATLLAGVCAVTIGYVGSVDGLFADTARTALDGALAPLRNVHKFDVVIRLPLAVGVAHLVGLLKWGRSDAEQRISRALVALIASAAVVGTASPLIGLRLAPTGSYVSLPGYWDAASKWLAKEGATSRALVVPAAHSDAYTWGHPSDGPLQPLARSPWTVRNGIPLVPLGNIRMLDAVGRQLDSAMPSDGLASYLSRAGIGYLVVRNDLDVGANATTRPAVLRAALSGSAGLRLVHAFGPPIAPGQLASTNSLRAVEIWSVGRDSDERVTAQLADQVVTVSGGPESLLDLSKDGLSARRPVVLTGDHGAGRIAGSTAVVTDGVRRRETTFGATTGNSSATLTDADPLRLAKPQRDYLSDSSIDSTSTARLIGVRSVLASSSGSDATSVPVVAAENPYSAVDGDQDTAWRSSLLGNGIGEWLQISFDSPRSVSTATVQFTDGSAVSEVAVRTDQGTALSDVNGDGPVRLRIPEGETHSLRITVTVLSGAQGIFHQVGIRELTIPGLQIDKTLDVPKVFAPGTRISQYAFHAAGDGRVGCLSSDGKLICLPDYARPDEDDVAVDRSFTATKAGSYRVAATAIARPGQALDALLQQALRSPVRASVSSRATADPRVGASALVDGDASTSWVASAQDLRPTVTLMWREPRTISELDITRSTSVLGTDPDELILEAPTAKRTGVLGADGRFMFAPLTTNRVVLTFSSSAGLKLGADPSTGFPFSMGITVAGITIPGISNTPITADQATVAIKCGMGPTLTLDGRTIATQLSTTVRAVRELSTVELVPCGVAEADVAQGDHRLRAASNGAWSARSVVLTAAGTDLSAADETFGRTTVLGWHSTDRRVQVQDADQDLLLVVHENANPGWHATLNGRSLSSVTVDGWQQGYLIPAHSQGIVHLTFSPDRPYRIGIALGFTCVVLGALAFLFWRRRPYMPMVAAVAWSGSRGGAVLGLIAMTIVGGFAGAVTWAVCAALTTVVVMVYPRRRDALLPTAAGLSFLVPTLALSIAHWPGPHYVAASAWSQIACLAALGLLSTAGLMSVEVMAESDAEAA